MARKSKVDTTNTVISEDELISFATAQFGKVTDFKDGEVVEILSPAYIMRTKFGAKRHINVRAGVGERIISLNKMSLTNLVRRLGADSEKWVHQTATVRITKVLDKDTIVLE